MRRFAAAAAFAALLGCLAAPANALDVEVTSTSAPADPDAEKPTPPPVGPGAETAKPVETGSVDPAAPTQAAEPNSPIGIALKALLDAETLPPAPASNPADTASATKPAPKPPHLRDLEAMKAFYSERDDEPIWVSKSGLNAKAEAAIAHIKGAQEAWGLDTGRIELPTLKAEGAPGEEPSEEDRAKAELTMSRAALAFHLLARGGTIYDAPKQISSYLDRRPQIRDRKGMLEEIARTADMADYFDRMHPQQAEFKRLLAAWHAAKAGKSSGAGKKVSAEQLMANMAQWRLMPEDLGDFYVWMNVPEYMIRIVKDGEVIWTERVTAGLVNKQTPIFSDEIERVTFKSKWRVPDSIKVKEVWPSLLKGGGMMRQFGLQMTRGAEGETIDWRKVDWSKADMNDYVLWQPPGPKNQLGIVKFSFPSKHRVYMHDTPDKHMFAWSRRAVSHGCMRVRNPLQMATILLERDKGWDRARIDDLARNGPEHNIVELDRKVPVHITYLTARIDEAGKVSTFADIYGHEKKVRLALAGQWSKIAVGSDHLAPLDQSRVPRLASTTPGKGRALREPRTLTELMFGGF
jgi:murein L,D-transpeptidase YcbB/YkuD